MRDARDDYGVKFKIFSRAHGDPPAPLQPLPLAGDESDWQRDMFYFGIEFSVKYASSEFQTGAPPNRPAVSGRLM
ncbi:MAG: hypothetical protein RLZZ505_1241 [Verrucomicrobiota bacterium]